MILDLSVTCEFYIQKLPVPGNKSQKPANILWQISLTFSPTNHVRNLSLKSEVCYCRNQPILICEIDGRWKMADGNHMGWYILNMK